MNSLSKDRENLREYIEKSVARLSDEDIAPSHLLGIATKATNQFEKVLLGLLRFYLDSAGVDYEQIVKPSLRKPLDKLTLGQLVECFRILNKELGSTCKAVFPNQKRLASRRTLIDKKTFETLDRVLALRKETGVAHNVLSEPKPTTSEKMCDLLSGISTIIDAPLFDVVSDD
jgi:hypothetical protein